MAYTYIEKPTVCASSQGNVCGSRNTRSHAASALFAGCVAIRSMFACSLTTAMKAIAILAVLIF